MDKQKKMIREITSLLGDLDLKDLAFLKEQASVLDYNRRVRLENEALQKEGAGSGRKSAVKKKTGSVKKRDDRVRIEQTERPKFFNVCVGNSRLFVDIYEIKALYKIASAAGSSVEAGPRLYRWFQKERSDLLSEVYIPNGKSPVLQNLYQALMDSFTSES